MAAVTEHDSEKITRTYNFTQQDFDNVKKIIYDRAGISLSSSKKDMVYSRLSRRLRANRLNNFREYLSFLDKGGAAEWEEFTNALTTNLTAFFREEHHFPILARHVDQRKNKPKIEIWCSAASTGEEPYSIAMAVVNAFKSYTPPVHILATDIDTNVLETAQQGIYGMDRLGKLSNKKLKNFFLKGSGSNAGSARVRPELRNLITYRQLNLLDDGWPIRGPFDVIFCRNVMIYFDKPTQYQILKKFSPLLASDGLLFAGHSESFHHAADLFTLREKTVYELVNKKTGE